MSSWTETVVRWSVAAARRTAGGRLAFTLVATIVVVWPAIAGPSAASPTHAAAPPGHAAVAGTERAGESALWRAVGTYGPTLAEILERFDQAQRQATTLVARFTEEKRVKLLIRPLVARGRFFFNQPNQVRWEYEDPERKVFVITEDHYTAYYPMEKRAQNVDLSTFVGKRLFRFLAVGQSSRDLAKYYNLGRVIDAGTEGTYLLLLTPRRERVREHLALLKIWLDAETFLPRRVAYEEPGGDTTLLTFQDLRVNADLAAQKFQVDLPSDVRVSTTFNGLALGQGGL